jgi:hypothetical protein
MYIHDAELKLTNCVFWSQHRTQKAACVMVRPWPLAWVSESQAVMYMYIGPLRRQPYVSLLRSFYNNQTLWSDHMKMGYDRLLTDTATGVTETVNL